MPHRIIIGSLKKKQYSSIYLLMGETSYFIDKISDYFCNNFFEDETLKDFNQQVVYGKDVTAEDIVSMAKEYPMMSEYRLIIVREFQELQKSAGTSKSDLYISLTDYAQNPQKHTVLVLCHKYGNIDKRSAFYKAVSKSACVFESPKVYDNQLPKYVIEIASEKKFKIKSETAQIIASYTGVDLYRIDKELDKFNNILKSGDEITAELVEKHIGISRIYNGFELVNALLERNEKKVFEIIHYFSTNPKNYPNPQIIAILYSSFIKLVKYPYLRDKSNLRQSLGINYNVANLFDSAAKYYTLPVSVGIIHLLKEYDLKSKGYNSCVTDGIELLKELVFRILYRIV